MKNFSLFLTVLTLIVGYVPLPVFSERVDVLRQASVYAEAGRVNEAAQLMRGFHPNGQVEETSWYLLAAKVAMARGQLARAGDYFERAQRLSNSSFAAALGLSQVQLASGQLIGARLQADAARKLNPSSAEPDLIYSEIDWLTGKREKGLQRMAEISSNRPDSEEVALSYARLLNRMGEKDAARNLLSTFSEKHPSAARVSDLLGDYIYLEGDRQKALDRKKIAIKLYEEQGNLFRRDVALAWVEARESGSIDLPVKSAEKKKSPTKDGERSDKFPFPRGVTITGGSGFVIDGGRKVVTNWHVVDGGKEFAIRTGLREVIKARVLVSSAADDIAILELDKPLPPERAIPDDAYVKPVVGQAIVVMGFPLWYVLGDNAPSLTNGIVSKVTGLRDDVATFQLTAKVNKGNSGGPVFDLSGNIVGITSGKLDTKRIQEEQGFTPEDVNFAIHVDKLPTASKAQVRSEPSQKPELSIEKLYQQMLGKVVMVATYR